MSVRGVVCLAVASAALSLVGCGGGAAPVAAVPPGEQAIVGSARVTVDVVNNTVRFEPIADSRAIFSGGAVSFQATQVLNEGTPARKVLKVSMRDSSNEKVISTASSFRLLFSGFRNINSPLTSSVGSVRTTTLTGFVSGASAVDGNVLNAVLVAPGRIAYEKQTKTLYFVENDTVRMVRDGTVTRIPGPFSSPYGIATLPPSSRFPLGAALVSDFNLNRVFLVQPNGAVAPIVGTGATGATNGANALSSTLHSPKGLSVEMINEGATADCWLVDQGGTKLRRFTIDMSDSTGFSDVVSGPFGSGSGLNDVLGAGSLLYYTEGHLLRVANKSNITGASMGATASMGSALGGFADGSGASAAFSSPVGMALVDNVLYLSDFGNHRIRQVTLRPGAVGLSASDFWVSTVSGTGSSGFQDGTTTMTHFYPTGIASTGGHGLFVSDYGSARLRTVVPLDGRFTVLAGTVSPSATDLPSLANPDGFVPAVPTKGPYQDNQVQINATDTYSLKQWEFIVPNGTQTFDFVVTVEATTTTAATLPSVTNTTGELGSPNVSVRTIAGDVTGGYADGPAGQAAFLGISDICVDHLGNVYVADTRTVRIITPSLRVHTIAGSAETVLGAAVSGNGAAARFKSLRSVTCNPDGTEVYVTDGAAVRLMRLTGADRTLAASWQVSDAIAGVVATPGSSTSDVVTGAAARFTEPYDIAWASEGNLYLCDGQANCVRRLTATPGENRTVATNWLVSHLAGSVSGIAGFGDGWGAPVQFSVPYQLAVTPGGDVLVADYQNNRLRKVTPGGNVTTVAGSVFGFSDGTPGLFRQPVGVAVDAAGYAYVSDSLSFAVRRVSPNSATTTVAGSGSASPKVDGTGATAKLQPWSLAITPKGDLYVAEANRVRLVQRIVRD